MIILIGKIGAGKTAIKNELLKLGYCSLPEFTTRPPRDGETNSIDYFFTYKNDFIGMNDNNLFAATVSYDVANGDTWYYGIPEWYIGNENGVLVTNPIALKRIYSKLDKNKDCVFYFKTDDDILTDRALGRKDDSDEVKRRIEADKKDFEGIEELATFSWTNDGVISCAELADLVSKIYKLRLNKSNIFIDADGVLIDTIKRITDMYCYDFMAYPDFKTINPWEIESWDFSECSLASAEYLDMYFNQKRFFDGVEFMPYAEEALWELKKYYNIHIVSTGSKPNLKLKRTFFKERLPFAQFIGVDHETYKDKSHVDMSEGIFIDDRADNLLTSNAKTKICFGDEYEWNKEWEQLRCHNWCDVMTYLGFNDFPEEVCI